MSGPYGPLDLPGYRLERLLGSGGFADVYLYTQELLRRPVAVKIMREHVEQDVVRAQFMTEANLMAQLASHPSIVTILSADVSAGGRPYIVMEYCSRPSLAERYKDRPLSVVEMLQTMIRLSGAVETAHRAGILHRDIKPANVLTTDYGWPALTDFGISAIVGEGTIGGGGMSVPWSPPEAFTGVVGLDERSDVYSLAATAYTLLAGHSPFDDSAQGLEMGAFVYRILESPVPEIPRSDIPGTLQRLLAVAMAKNPEERPPSAASFARALQRIEQDLSLPATPLDVPDTLVEDLERTQTRMRAPDAEDATATWSAGPGASADRTVARTAEDWQPAPADLDGETRVVASTVSGPEAGSLEAGSPAAGGHDDLDDATVVVEEADDRTVVVDRDDDRTVVVDRRDDRTVVVPPADDRTVVVDRADSDATEIIGRAPTSTRTSRADVPVSTRRVAYVPDPDEIARYRARRQAPIVEPMRVSIAPPPQRASVDPAAAAKQGRTQRRRSLVGLIIALAVVGIVVVTGAAVLALVLVTGAGS